MRRVPYLFPVFFTVLFVNHLFAQSPVITGITPASVVAGQPVTITGTGFGSTSGFVAFGNFFDPYNISWTDTQIVVTVPANAQSGPIFIQTSNGTQSNSVNLTVVYPTITSINPVSVVTGQQVTITGTGFGTTSGYVAFGNFFDPYNISWTDTQIVVTVPANAQTGPVHVQTAGGGQSNSLNLTVVYPTITSITPSTAVVGQPVTITGTNFGTTSGYVAFGGLFYPYNTSWTDTQIVVTVPANAQTGPVHIQTSGGGQSNSVNLTLGPGIISVSPTTAVAGQAVTITGTGFGAASGYVAFGNLFDPYNTSWTDTQIVVAVPANAQTGPVHIQTAGGGQSNSVNLTVEYPTITSITPSTVVTGQQVTITGTGFGTASGYVAFGNFFDPYNISWTDTQIVVTVPANAQTGPVHIQTAGGGQSNSANLAVEYPTITSITPSTVVAGQQVTITGTNFGATSAYVAFGNLFYPYNTSWSDQQIVVTVPMNAQTGPVHIQTAGGGQSNSVNLTVSYGVALSPSSLTFTSQTINTSSSVQTVTLSNSGSAALNIAGIAFTGDNATDFSQANTCSSFVAAGGSCTIAILFTPNAAGPRAASLSIVDDASDSPQAAPLSGTGTMHDVTLSWDPSSTTGISGYNVYRSTTPGGESPTPLNSTPISGTTYRDENVEAGQQYYYVVAAVGLAGLTESFGSAEASVTIPSP